MSRLVEAVRNSPLLRGKQSHGQYSPILQQSNDPFVQGISFMVSYMGSAEMVDRVGTDTNHSIISKKLDEVQKEKKDKDLPKVVIEIKAISLTLRSLKGASQAVYPIYTVSYCGNARDADTIFFFIFKSKKDQKIYAEIFKCTNREKVAAINRTVSKAFSIAYKAWQMKKRMQQRNTQESPLLQQKVAKERDTINMTKEAVEKAAGSTGGAYTPPIPRKTPEKSEASGNGRPRSGSTGKDDPTTEEIAMSHSRKNPALARVQVKNEASGK